MGQELINAINRQDSQTSILMSENNLNPFIADVLSLKLKFAVPMIAKRTGDEKRNVSAWIHARKPAPPDFLVRFYSAFKKELAEKGIHRDVNAFIGELSKSSGPVTEKDFLRSINIKLTEQNELLKELIGQQKTTNQKLDELLRRKDKEIMKAVRSYLMGMVATFRPTVDD